MKRQNPPLTFAGPSILETAWKHLDAATDAAMEPDADARVKGEATGMSTIVAIFLNPASPDPKAVRKEAKRRFRERQAQ